MADNFDYGIGNLNMPFSNDAEQSVLGAILIEPSCLERVLPYVKPECFYIPQNKAVFEAMLRLFGNNQPIDLITVLEELSRDENYDQTGGRAYLTGLAELVPSISNVEEYAKIVREKYYARSLIAASRTIIDSAVSGQENADVILESAEQAIYNIRQGRDTTGLVHIGEIIVNDIYPRLQKLNSDDREQYLGLSTGMKAVDDIITGLNKSDLIILAARPGVGKTSFALNVASNVAVKSHAPVAIFSLEMSNEQLVQRMLSSTASLPSDRFRLGKLSDSEWIKLVEAGGVLSEAPIYIDDTSNISVNQMKAKLRRIKNLGLVIIDYLQLMSLGKPNVNSVQEITEITRNLKIMAKELNVPVIVLSQLRRISDQTGNEHKPKLSDLRGSGSIEQDADIVLFLYREAENAQTEEDKLRLKNDAELIVGKNRHGAQGSIKLFWSGEYTRFESKEVRYDDSASH